MEVQDEATELDQIYQVVSLGIRRCRAHQGVSVFQSRVLQQFIRQSLKSLDCHLALQMTYVQATQGGGGWPMSVFLTPNLQPFLAGTYFPPQDMYGRPGFKTLLRRITAVWSSKKEEVKQSSADTFEQLVSLSVLEGASSNTSLTAAKGTYSFQESSGVLLW